MFTDAQEDEDYADSRILDGYRQQRMNQLKEAAFRNRFGEVFDIVKADWIKEVTEASNNCIVIVHLYENSIVECEVLDEAMRVLAPKFKYLKFLRIKSTHAIENWPERNLPALFIYEDGAMKTQLVTLKSLDGKSTKAEGNSPAIIDICPHHHYYNQHRSNESIKTFFFPTITQTWSGFCLRRAS